MLTNSFSVIAVDNGLFGKPFVPITWTKYSPFRLGQIDGKVMDQLVSLGRGQSYCTPRLKTRFASKDALNGKCSHSFYLQLNMARLILNSAFS